MVIFIELPKKIQNRKILKDSFISFFFQRTQAYLQ